MHINFGGIHYNDGRDYLTGEANIFLKNENGEIEKPKEVKIYLEKDGKRIDIYNGNISGTNYYFDMIVNNLEGEYTIYAEAKADDRKYI